LSSSLSS